MDGQASIDPSKLSPSDRLELQTFLENESKKSRVQQCTYCILRLRLSCHPSASLFGDCLLFHHTNGGLAVHNLTDICWTKCVSGSFKSGQLDKNEDACARNCVDRFLDVNSLVIQHLSDMNSSARN